MEAKGCHRIDNEEQQTATRTELTADSRRDEPSGQVRGDSRSKNSDSHHIPVASSPDLALNLFVSSGGKFYVLDESYEEAYVVGTSWDECIENLKVKPIRTLEVVPADEQ